MVYRAEFRNFKAITAVTLAVVAATLVTAASAHDVRLVLIGLCVAAALLWVRFRVRLVLADQYFEYVGPLARRRVNWEEITRERSILAAGYPTKQIFGPLVHEFWTRDGVTRVSFLFFPLGSLSEVLSRARAHRKKQ